MTLQRRLDSSDSEAKALHEKLREASSANVRLSSELEQAHAMLKHHNARAVEAATVESGVLISCIAYWSCCGVGL